MLRCSGALGGVPPSPPVSLHGFAGPGTGGQPMGHEEISA